MCSNNNNNSIPSATGRTIEVRPTFLTDGMEKVLQLKVSMEKFVNGTVCVCVRNSVLSAEIGYNLERVTKRVLICCSVKFKHSVK